MGFKPNKNSFKNNLLFKNLGFDNDNDMYARRKDKDFYPGSLDNNQATPVHPTQVISPFTKGLNPLVFTKIIIAQATRK